MNRVKVAHIGTVDLVLRYLLLNQMKQIRDAGYDVTGISSRGRHTEVLLANGIKHIPVTMTRRFSPLTDVRAFWRLFRTMRRERFDIIHTHTPKAALLAQYAAALARIPVRIHTIHGLYFPGHMDPRRRWAFVLLERITMIPSHLNLSQNPEDVPVAIAEKICRPDRIELLGNGIDVTALDPALQTSERRESTRENLGLTAENKVVGMVARFVREKGYLELLEAARIVRERIPDVRFILVGAIETEKQDALKPDLINDMGLADNVSFLGHRDDVVDLYGIMDILALPSHREGFPRTVMEAASMGIPAVVTDIRGCRQVVTDGVTGQLVPLRDPEALAAALLDLLTNDHKRKAFGQAAREKALVEFDERLVFSRVLNAYERLLPRSNSASSRARRGAS